jgi:hypothetical protein
MRPLKFHEQKLLKKVNFLEWKKEDRHREGSVIQRYLLTHRDDYKKYPSFFLMFSFSIQNPKIFLSLFYGFQLVFNFVFGK